MAKLYSPLLSQGFTSICGPTSVANVLRSMRVPAPQFAHASEAALQEIAGATKPTGGRDLLVDTTIEPGGRKTFKVAARPPEDFDSFVLELYEKLEKIPAPSIPDGSIHFQSKFRLRGGSGSGD